MNNRDTSPYPIFGRGPSLNEQIALKTVPNIPK